LEAAEEELEKNPSYHRQERSKATQLMEGSLSRGMVYRSAEAKIDALIDAHTAEIEVGIRQLRRDDIGEEAAAAEESKGSKTDEQYATEAAAKREAREQDRREARERERVALEEKRKARKKEEEKKAEAERAEREAKRKADREREEEKEKDLRDRERNRDRDRDRGRDRDRERERPRDDRYKRYDDDFTHRGHRDSKDIATEDEPLDKEVPAIKTELSQEEIERLEKEALDDLLKEGKRISLIEKSDGTRYRRVFSTSPSKGHASLSHQTYF